MEYCQKLIYHGADNTHCSKCFDVDVNGCVWSLRKHDFCIQSLGATDGFSPPGAQ